MAYSQLKKLTDTEKKLQALRKQLYGRPDVQRTSKEEDQPSSSFSFSTKSNSVSNNKAADSSYLKRDLAKTLIFASFAIGAQVILKFVVRS